VNAGGRMNAGAGVNPVPKLELPALLARVDQLLVSAGPANRVLLGITGPPGSGKSTLAERLTAALTERTAQPRAFVAYLPMDGYHLADVELRRLGRSDRKGAPDTFDAAGYLALLTRLRSAGAAGSGTIWAPAFDRELEQPIAGSIPVDPSVRVVITEGNYLLLDDPAWRPIREALAEVWFCAPPDDVRLRRLVARHEQFGKSAEHAWQWAHGTDQRNAELIHATQRRADLIIDPFDLADPDDR
jgi:pantothenate kinase